MVYDRATEQLAALRYGGHTFAYRSVGKVG
jgi:hypothetical protein